MFCERRQRCSHTTDGSAIPGIPVLPPIPESSYDSTRCMTPFVVRVGDEYRLYYSGGDNEGFQRICLATAPVEKPGHFTRHGVILDIGEAGAFDARWCVVPYVLYTANSYQTVFFAVSAENLLELTVFFAA